MVAILLKEYANQNHPLSSGKLRRLLYEKYDMSISRPTLYAAFGKLQYIGCISHYVPGKGYYLENDELTVEEILIVCRLISLAGDINTDQRNHLLHKLYKKMSRWDRTVYRDMVLGKQIVENCHESQSKNRKSRTQ